MITDTTADTKSIIKIKPSAEEAKKETAPTKLKEESKEIIEITVNKDESKELRMELDKLEEENVSVIITKLKEIAKGTFLIVIKNNKYSTTNNIDREYIINHSE